MKILHIISSANPAGGGPIEGVKQRAKVLTAMGHTIEVACCDAPDSPWLKDFPLTIYPLGPGNGTYAFTNGLQPWIADHHAEYDACIINGIWQYHGLAAWKVLRNSTTPYFVFTHGMLDPWFKVTYPLKHLKKTFYWLYAEHNVLRDAAAVCFTSEEEMILARTSFKPYTLKERIVGYGTTVPIGNLEAQVEAFRKVCPETRGKQFLLFLSRIHVKKGCDILLESFAKIAQNNPNMLLVMAGPDKTQIRPSLERIADSLGISDRITWPGMLSGDAKWGAFHSADAFVLPSHQENFGIAVVEALACGCPVLISNKVNIWREIEADGAGIIGNDDVAGTSAVLQQWMELTDNEKTEYRKRAFNCFNARYELQKNASTLIDLISETTACR